MRIVKKAFKALLIMTVISAATSFVFADQTGFVAQILPFKIVMNNQGQTFDSPIVTIDGTTYVPLREFCAKMNGNINVDWQPQNQQINITQLDNSNQPTAGWQKYSYQNNAGYPVTNNYLVIPTSQLQRDNTDLIEVKYDKRDTTQKDTATQEIEDVFDITLSPDTTVDCAVMKDTTDIDNPAYDGTILPMKTLDAHIIVKEEQIPTIFKNYQQYPQNRLDSMPPTSAKNWGVTTDTFDWYYIKFTDVVGKLNNGDVMATSGVQYITFTKPVDGNVNVYMSRDFIGWDEYAGELSPDGTPSPSPTPTK